jgi:hypothetical protein
MKHLTMRHLLSSSMAIVLACYSALSYAEPTTSPTYINSIRPYVMPNQPNVSPQPAGFIFITVEQSDQCNTTYFKLDLTIPGAKEVYAAALTAFVSHLPVRLEVLNSAGCSNGTWTALQSITVMPN